MAGLLNLLSLLLVLALLWSLVSILYPIRPFRTRLQAFIGFIGAFIVIMLSHGWIDDAQTKLDHEAFKAEQAWREQLKTESPAEYAKLMEREAEVARLREEERKRRVAAKLAKESAALADEMTEQESDFLAEVKASASKVENVALIAQADGPLAGELVRVTHYDPEPWSEKFLLEVAAEAYRRAARTVFEKRPEASGIQFIVKTNAVDEYKRSEPAFAFVLSLTRAQMEKIAWDRITGADVLNLSTVDRKSLGRNIARAYCEDMNREASEFCRAAAR